MDRKDNKIETKRDVRTKPLQSISKWLHGICDCQAPHCGSIDSHEWESKVEAFRNLSDSYR